MYIAWLKGPPIDVGNEYGFDGSCSEFVCDKHHSPYPPHRRIIYNDWCFRLWTDDMQEWTPLELIWTTSDELSQGTVSQKTLFYPESAFYRADFIVSFIAAIDFFRLFFTNTLLETIVLKTNKYARNKYIYINYWNN